MAPQKCRRRPGGSWDGEGGRPGQDGAAVDSRSDYRAQRLHFLKRRLAGAILAGDNATATRLRPIVDRLLNGPRS
jgi:hypothetical protein